MEVDNDRASNILKFFVKEGIRFGPSTAIALEAATGILDDGGKSLAVIAADGIENYRTEYSDSAQLGLTMQRKTLAGLLINFILFALLPFGNDALLRDVVPVSNPGTIKPCATLAANGVIAIVEHIPSTAAAFVKNPFFLDGGRLWTKLQQ